MTQKGVKRNSKKPAVTIQISEEEILHIIGKHEKERGSLIAILDDIQKGYGYLPEEALRLVSKNTEHSIVDIYGVATFYHSFRLEPRGKHFVSVCLGTACHVRGGPSVVAEFENKLKIKAGNTTSDNEFTLETVNCLGACALGPVVVIDGVYHSQVRKQHVQRLISKTIEGKRDIPIKRDKRIFPINVQCPTCNHSLMDERHRIEGHPSIGVTVSFKRKHGWFRFSSLYGSHEFKSKHTIPKDIAAHFFCPHCHTDLNGPLNCPSCSAPMISMLVTGGGRVQSCSKLGCKTHQLDI